MTWILLLKLSLVQLRRHAIRTLLTLLGTACGLFLFITVETFQTGLRKGTEVQAGDDLLIVYRDKRFCPYTSRLPENYERKIAELKGVKSVVPVQVIVNHCGTGLDTITFRGFPKAKGQSFFGSHVSPEKLKTWQLASDSALIGQELANRRGLKEGEHFEGAGIRVRIAGIISSDDPQILNTAYVHLDYLQQVSGRGLGEVTQFNVRVDGPESMPTVAKAIDDLFRHDREPTHTRPEKAFVAQTAGDMLELITFTRYLGLAAVVAVILLMSNTIAIAVRGRLTENAIFHALGFQEEHLIWMVFCEGLVLALVGAVVAIAGSTSLLMWGNIAISAEGLSIVFRTEDIRALEAFGVAIVMGLLSGLLPALGLTRGELVQKLRAA